jgi:hypothetical protein
MAQAAEHASLCCSKGRIFLKAWISKIIRRFAKQMRLLAVVLA